jgi:hypothetical protein
MNEMTLDQKDEGLLTYEVSDEVLEVAACTGKANTFTQWVCTSVYFCPGPLRPPTTIPAQKHSNFADMITGGAFASRTTGACGLSQRSADLYLDLSTPPDFL